MSYSRKTSLAERSVSQRASLVKQLERKRASSQSSNYYDSTMTGANTPHRPSSDSRRSSITPRQSTVAFQGFSAPSPRSLLESAWGKSRSRGNSDNIFPSARVEIPPVARTHHSPPSGGPLFMDMRHIPAVTLSAASDISDDSSQTSTIRPSKLRHSVTAAAAAASDAPRPASPKLSPPLASTHIVQPSHDSPKLSPPLSSKPLMLGIPEPGHRTPPSPTKSSSSHSPTQKSPTHASPTTTSPTRISPLQSLSLLSDQERLELEEDEREARRLTELELQASTASKASESAKPASPRTRAPAALLSPTSALLSEKVIKTSFLAVSPAPGSPKLLSPSALRAPTSDSPRNHSPMFTSISQREAQQSPAEVQHIPLEMSRTPPRRPANLVIKTTETNDDDAGVAQLIPAKRVRASAVSIPSSSGSASSVPEPSTVLMLPHSHQTHSDI